MRRNRGSPRTRTRTPPARASGRGRVPRGKTRSISKDGSPRGPEKYTEVLGEGEPRQVRKLGRNPCHGIAGRSVGRRHDAGADRLEREARPAGDAGPPIRFVGAPADPAQVPRPYPPPGLGGTVSLAAAVQIRAKGAPTKRGDEDREEKIARAFSHPEREAPAWGMEQHGAYAPERGEALLGGKLGHRARPIDRRARVAQRRRGGEEGRHLARFRDDADDLDPLTLDERLEPRRGSLRRLARSGRHDGLERLESLAARLLESRPCPLG